MSNMAIQTWRPAAKESWWQRIRGRFGKGSTAIIRAEELSDHMLRDLGLLDGRDRKGDERSSRVDVERF